MIYSGEDIKERKKAIINNIIKSFSNSDEEIEKAHVEGEIHPNGKWYWKSSARGGKGDWRVIKKKGKKNEGRKQKDNIVSTNNKQFKFESNERTSKDREEIEKIPKGFNDKTATPVSGKSIKNEQDEIIKFNSLEDATKEMKLKFVGTEAKCYIKEKGEVKTIRKVINSLSHYASDYEFTNSKNIYNKYFPETAYKFIGLISHRDSIFVYDQPYLIDSKILKPDDLPPYPNQDEGRKYINKIKKAKLRIRTDMKKRGWTLGYPDVNGYDTFTRDGIRAFDFHLENVMENEKGKLQYPDISFEFIDEDKRRESLTKIITI